ncbi:MAG: hypothetical protein L0H41_00920 [Microlunatus sp.]|nr:hypothetical protein [Microlunatus sp.]MDN5769933.1 hypothetical protein [Microlunatus sp.]
MTMHSFSLRPLWLAARKAMARQVYLHERYLDGLGTSGSEARASLDGRSDEHELERWYEAPAIPDWRRRPARPIDN